MAKHPQGYKTQKELAAYARDNDGKYPDDVNQERIERGVKRGPITALLEYIDGKLSKPRTARASRKRLANPR